jgi:Uma2 family endonuclease
MNTVAALKYYSVEDYLATEETPDLQDYILISQDKVHVEHFVKQAPGRWLMSEYNTFGRRTGDCATGRNAGVGRYLR